MARRNKELAKKQRSILLELLGNKCKLEHTGKCAGGLEFDCIIPMGHDHHKGSTDQRMSFYWKQHFKHHNIQILCHRHNAVKSRRDTQKQVRKEENEPF